MLRNCDSVISVATELGVYCCCQPARETSRQYAICFMDRTRAHNGLPLKALRASWPARNLTFGSFIPGLDALFLLFEPPRFDPDESALTLNLLLPSQVDGTIGIEQCNTPLSARFQDDDKDEKEDEQEQQGGQDDQQGQ